MRTARCLQDAARAFTLIELLFVIVILAILIAVLLPVLSHVRTAEQRLDREPTDVYAQVSQAGDQVSGESVAAAAPRASNVQAAQVRCFDATVALTPKLSVGTADPESIYEATFTATLQAAAPSSAKEAQLCELDLPLPPRICAVEPHLQGMLLTIGAMGLFVLTMSLMPRIQTQVGIVSPMPASALA